MSESMSTITDGERRRFPNGYSLPHLSIYVPADAIGTVAYADEHIVSVRMDEPIPNLHDSEWENCIDFAISDDPGCFEAYTVPFAPDHP